MEDIEQLRNAISNAMNALARDFDTDPDENPIPDSVKDAYDILGKALDPDTYITWAESEMQP